MRRFRRHEPRIPSLAHYQLSKTRGDAKAETNHPLGQFINKESTPVMFFQKYYERSDEHADKHKVMLNPVTTDVLFHNNI